MPIPEKLKAWTDHLTKYRKAHPDLSLKQCMIEAKKTYKKGSGKMGPK